MTYLHGGLIKTPGINIVRAYCLVGASLSAGCVAPDKTNPDDRQSGGMGDLDLVLSRDAADRATLLVTVTNRSANPVCIRAEALQNPHSGEMHLRLRDANGRPLEYYKHTGIIPPPLTGVVRLAPGSTVRGRFRLDTRFRRIAAEQRLPLGWSAQAAFRYGHCDDVWSLQASSTWQRI